MNKYVKKNPLEDLVKILDQYKEKGGNIYISCVPEKSLPTVECLELTGKVMNFDYNGIVNLVTIKNTIKTKKSKNGILEIPGNFMSIIDPRCSLITIRAENENGEIIYKNYKIVGEDEENDHLEKECVGSDCTL